MTQKLLPLAFLLLLGSAALVQRQDRDVEVVVHPVAGAVAYLEGRGGNIGVSTGPDGVLIIDDQFADLAPKIERALASLAEGDPRWVLNTHWHGDHTGGNAHFGRKGTIVAHDNVRRRLAGDPTIEGRTQGRELPAEALPVVTYSESLTLHFNGEEIRVLHFPSSHTDGDSAVWFTGSGVVHLGDLYFSSAFPFVDLDSGGSVGGLIDTLGRVIEMLPDGTRIIAGHGPATGIDGLVEYRDMLVEARSRVERALADGWDEAEMRSNGLLDDLAERWEPERAFVDRSRMIATLVRDLSRR